MPHFISEHKKNVNGWSSFILGIIGSVAWFFPIVGLPLTITGTVLGSVGLKNKKNQGVAIAGLVINIIFLVITTIKMIIDIALYIKNNNQ
ncbi:MAG: hypothetical protein ATN36_08960 [Epulopiscium sp. Nele67-Bin005]|nr:MAG: hypothetical protein ATN36_08960 [Epulopiscium sp. Nele67-Bin005]